MQFISKDGLTYNIKDADIDEAIRSEIEDWLVFFDIEPTDENREGRRLFHRANLALNHLGGLEAYLTPEE
jgi:hypothetical protein